MKYDNRDLLKGNNEISCSSSIDYDNDDPIDG